MRGQSRASSDTVRVRSGMAVAKPKIIGIAAILLVKDVVAAANYY
jgi:hypothetical protein